MIYRNIHNSLSQKSQQMIFPALKNGKKRKDSFSRSSERGYKEYKHFLLGLQPG